MHPLLLQAMIPHPGQLRHKFRCLSGLDSFEAYPLPAVRVSLNNVAVPLFVFSSVPYVTLCQTMQLKDSFLRNRKTYPLPVDKVKGLPVSPHLLLIPVSQQLFAEYDRLNAAMIHHNAFDPVRGNSALNQRMLPQGLQPLRRLPGEELLLASRLAKI